MTRGVKCPDTCDNHHKLSGKKAIVGTRYGFLKNLDHYSWQYAKKPHAMGCRKPVWPIHRFAKIYICDSCTVTLKQAANKSSNLIVYSRLSDSIPMIILWKNLRVIPMDTSKYGLPKDYEKRGGGEDHLKSAHKINSIYSLSKKDLRSMRKYIGKKTEWDVYIDIRSSWGLFLGETYYVWLNRSAR
jgi:hypothetical protein